MNVDKETIRAFSEIDKAIDDSFLKLSDKLQNLTLSHNRKKKALKIISDIFRTCIWSSGNLQIKSVTFSVDELKEFIGICDNALFCDGRVNCKPVKRKEVDE